MVLGNHPQAVALFFALSSGAAPVIVLPPELRGWRSAPPLPPGSHVVLVPALRRLEPEARQLGLDVTVLPEPRGDAGSSETAAFMTSPGFVLFTSGSTDLPRPVFRSSSHLLGGARALMAAVGTPRDGGVIASLPLARGFGLLHGLMAATVRGTRLALQERFDHNALLEIFASRDYHYWAGTPVMAGALARAHLSGPHPAPPVCVIAGRLSADVCRQFEARFGVPLRQTYGTTETGSVTVDGAPASAVRSETAGRPLPGVALRVGDGPHDLLPPGQTGRIWVSSPSYMMDGYGFPPDLAPLDSVDGWWPTPDVGLVDEAGYLTHSGRLDECVRTGAGYLVNPAEVAATVERFPGVSDTAVAPLDTAAGPVLGVLVQADSALDLALLRSHLADALPPWAQPRVLEVTGALPRLTSGRIDRMSCIEILSRHL
jgi:rifamycin polyketide synthase module 1/2/3